MCRNLVAVYAWLLLSLQFFFWSLLSVWMTLALQVLVYVFFLLSLQFQRFLMSSFYACWAYTYTTYMFKTIECHANAWEQRSTKKTLYRCCCHRRHCYRRHHCRHQNALATECVHICGKPLFWFVAHCQHSYTSGHVGKETRREEKRTRSVL